MGIKYTVNESRNVSGHYYIQMYDTTGLDHVAFLTIQGKWVWPVDKEGIGFATDQHCFFPSRRQAIGVFKTQMGSRVELLENAFIYRGSRE